MSDPLPEISAGQWSRSIIVGAQNVRCVVLTTHDTVVGLATLDMLAAIPCPTPNINVVS